MEMQLSDVEVLTAHDAEPMMAAAAGWLLGQGLRSGDRVAFSMGSSSALLCAVLGAARVGIVPVVLNATLLEHERDSLLEDCDPRVSILSSEDLTAMGEGPAAEMADYPLTRPMHYTSGTTGKPKGVTSGIWDSATANVAFDEEANVWGFGPSDTHLVCSPMYHTVGIRLSAATLLSGGSLIILPHFEANVALEALRRLQPTTAFFVPTHLHRLLGLEQLGENEIFDSLRLLMHAGAPCPPALKREAIRRVHPNVVWEFYGATEGQFTRCSTQEWLDHPGTVGKARPGRTLSIVPTNPNDAVGTIWCEVPSFARFSYFGDEAATNAAWDGERFSVGDVGSLDEEGYLYINGRRSDLIISGGVNVYPAEIEAALSEIPGVREVCVFGRDDPAWGQRVCVAITGEASLREGDVLEGAKTLLAPYKRPKEIHLTDSLPLGPTGKILRDQVPGHLGLDETH